MLTVQGFRRLFGEERQCAAQLTRQRWPEGFRCPRCSACGYQCSVTAGTIFHKTRTPLFRWFWAIYRMSHDKKDISAAQLAEEIGVSYPTAWRMQHKIRKAMEDREQSYRLHGLVEVDEGYVGGQEPGTNGRGSRTKSVVAVAVEHAAEGQSGRLLSVL